MEMVNQITVYCSLIVLFKHLLICFYIYLLPTVAKFNNFKYQSYYKYYQGIHVFPVAYTVVFIFLLSSKEYIPRMLEEMLGGTVKHETFAIFTILKNSRKLHTAKFSCS